MINITNQLLCLVWTILGNVFQINYVAVILWQQYFKASQLLFSAKFFLFDLLNRNINVIYLLAIAKKINLDLYILCIARVLEVGCTIWGEPYI